MVPKTATLVQQLRTFVIENFLFGGQDALTDEQSFLETGLIDSTGVLQLVAFLEQSYGIEISDDELIPENLDSIRNISAFLRTKSAL
jgi:acyl carrier protein